ncbi:M20/M25/M40 family metallo-hydrolase [Cryobacterium sp. Hh7]|uniref:M20/M25/M40 family metallo-hydrolase n=1 Tax=Cryobacterium sp. Hh7 TaxID=1259159 RepID=UPI0018E08AF2|nr:M20/M25/M40 family metallo-hydrolase [Cryobacterium sp. Hh7]
MVSPCRGSETHFQPSDQPASAASPGSGPDQRHSPGAARRGCGRTHRAVRPRPAGRALPFALEVVAFGDEEGTRFGTPLLGSRALAGTWQAESWELRDRNGVRLEAAYRPFGLDPALIGAAARTPANLIGYLEAHIEQGPVLDDSGLALGLALGVASSIAGARRFNLVIEGAAAHSDARDGGLPPTPFSMAGHDAMALAALTDIGMLLVRCRGGISHHPDESVTEADVALALDAFEAAVLALAEQYDAEEMDSEFDARACALLDFRGDSDRSGRATGRYTGGYDPDQNRSDRHDSDRLDSDRHASDLREADRCASDRHDTDPAAQ